MFIGFRFCAVRDERGLVRGGAVEARRTRSGGGSRHVGTGLAPVDELQQALGGGPAPRDGVGAHRRQRRPEVAGDGGVVEPGDRQVVRDVADRAPGPRTCRRSPSGRWRRRSRSAARAGRAARWVAWAPPRGREVGPDAGRLLEPGRRQGVGPGLPAGAGVDELVRARRRGRCAGARAPTRCSTAAAMPGRSSTATHGPAARRSEPGRSPRPAGRATSSRAGLGSSTRRSVRNTPSTRPLAASGLVAAALGLLVGDHLQQQGLAALGQRHLDAGDEGGEERVGAERLRLPGDHQPDRQRPRRGQRARPVAGGEARARRRPPGSGPGWHRRTPGRSFSANETAPLETPAARATSAMVGRGSHSFTKPV